MEFNLSEKLALIKLIDSVIVVDDIIHEEELTILNLVMQRLGFESNFLFHAKNLDYREALAMLQEMAMNKKELLGKILHDVSKADGFVHKKETALIRYIFSSIGIGNTTP